MCVCVCMLFSAISFSGLLASSTPLLNIIGAYLFWSVLFDTFIVRRCVLMRLCMCAYVSVCVRQAHSAGVCERVCLSGCFAGV